MTRPVADDSGGLHPGRSWVAFTAVVIAVAISSIALVEPISAYDGGITASSAIFTLHGRIPYADYWLLYGPLSGFLLALPTAVVGPSSELLRFAGLATVAMQAGFGTFLLVRWTYPAAAVSIGVMSAVLPPAVVGLELSAWSMAIALAVLALWLRIEVKSSFLVGIVVGLTFATRLDVGGYLLLALLLLPDRRGLVAGFACLAVPFAVLALATAELPALIEQLIWYPIVGPREFRGLPGLASKLDGAELVLMSMALVFLPRLAILAGAIRAHRFRSRHAWALVLFAGLCQLQTLGRGDPAHFAMAATPAILLLGLWTGQTRPSGSMRTRLPSVLASAVVASLISGAFTLGVKRAVDQGFATDVSLRSSVEVIRTLTSRDEPIFAALAANRITYLNPLIAYYLADRAAGTTKTMFNPGVTNTDAAQQVMVEELEQSATKVLILDTVFSFHYELENASRNLGSTVLDTYIAEKFRTLCDFGEYLVAVRSDDPDMPATCPVNS